jgi:hypothetical protein
VLGLADVGPGQGGISVFVRDRLAFDADLLPAHRHGLLHFLGDDVLAQPRPTRLAALGADVHAFLRARHGVIAADAGVRGAGHAGRLAGVGVGPAARAGLVGLLPGRVPVDAVVLVQAVLLLFGEVAAGVDVDVGGVLDRVLGVEVLQMVLQMEASWIGTNDSLVPNRPVLTLTHSGWPVASSRKTCLASPIWLPSVS